MSGGVVYFRLDPKMGLTLAALEQRLAPGSNVRLTPLDDSDEQSVAELLSAYAEILQQYHHHAELQLITSMMKNVKESFVKGEAVA